MKTTMRTWIVLVAAAVFLSGCGMIPANWGKLEGRAWCDIRYLDTVKEFNNFNPEGKKPMKRLQLSKSGYMYAVAAVLPLQNPLKDTDFNFSKPKRLEEISDLRENLRNGFDAMTFILNDEVGNPVQTIISFGGSNQLRDYLLHNFWLFPVQYDSARAYVNKVFEHPDTKGLPIIAVGISLGGGLAVHVKKTDGRIQEAWAFNPSPRTGVPSGEDSSIYLLANKYEILNRWNREHLGATLEHTDTKFELINSSSIYGHYRWVLTRQILHFADLALFYESGRSSDLTEPMEILQTQQISSRICTTEMRKNIEQKRREQQTRSQQN